jgi:DICT domain-containing protein
MHYRGSPRRFANENKQRDSFTWNFDPAIEVLARQHPCRIVTGNRDDCKFELDVICRSHMLERFVEAQETNGAKASAFQRERRWYKQRATRTKKAPRLAQALEQEVARLQAKGLSYDESCITLRDQYKDRSTSGGTH